MKPEDRELLLKDLCPRLPYNVWVSYKTKYDDIERATILNGNYIRDIMEGTSSWIDFKPYLRPMSSMTEEEARDIAILHGYDETEILFVKVMKEHIEVTLLDDFYYPIISTIRYDDIISSIKCFDYLNKKMFDFRGLIPKGHALSTEEHNPYLLNNK